VIADATGYLASALVFAAFCTKEMIPLRVVGLCSNLAFIVYGLELDLHPICFARDAVADERLATLAVVAPEQDGRRGSGQAAMECLKYSPVRTVDKPIDLNGRAGR
jgi:hypothetical protein